MNFVKLLICAALLFLGLQIVFATPHIFLKAVHVTTTVDEAKIIFDLNGTPDYKVFTLADPLRLVVDLPTTHCSSSLIKHIALENTAIVQMRTGHPTPDTLRIVLDLAKPLSHTESLEEKKLGKQLIITLRSTNVSAVIHKGNLQQTQEWLKETLPQTIPSTPLQLRPSSLPKTAEANPPATDKQTDKILTELEATKSAVITALSPQGHRSIVVVIDPGHGGKDPGTSGSMGVLEKDVVLAISMDLKKILEEMSGFKPVVTREQDYFIPLRGRLAIARKYHGDMFIAIHADAYKDPYAKGASVFALSAHGASSEAARWLAEKENYSECGGVNLSDKSYMLRSVLIDLSQTATISSSIQLGSSIISQLAKVGHLHYRTVEQAPFMVLKSPDIPSILVETGFLSNAEDQERLRNPVAQMQIAKALAVGIENYFRKNPPPGTGVTLETPK